MNYFWFFAMLVLMIQGIYSQTTQSMNTTEQIDTKHGSHVKKCTFFCNCVWSTYFQMTDYTYDDALYNCLDYFHGDDCCHCVSYYYEYLASNKTKKAF